MKQDDPAKLDPELLADPLEPEDSRDSGDSAGSTELVPTGTGSLARYDPFRRYMAEIRKYPPLTREEEQELARLYRETGSREALLRLVSANLMLVVRVAFSFRRAARNLLDLIQEGNIGLLQAIERFDPDLGVRIPTYAAWWIRAYMVKFLLDNVRMVRVGTTNARRKLLRNLRKEKQRLEEQGFEVGPRLLAERFGVSEADVIDVEAALESRDVSLDAPLGPQDSRPQAEILPDPREEGADEQLARHELQSRTEQVLAQFRVGLSPRDLALLDERILSDSPLTLQALGERFGTTREAVRQAEVRLMRRLKELLTQELGDAARISLESN